MNRYGHGELLSTSEINGINGDEIVLYNASNYEKGCRITLGTNVYPDKEGIDASGCDLIVLVIEVRI